MNTSKSPFSGNLKLSNVKIPLSKIINTQGKAPQRSYEEPLQVYAAKKEEKVLELT
jgi:hypothetical protein